MIDMFPCPLAGGGARASANPQTTSKVQVTAENARAAAPVFRVPHLGIDDLTYVHDTSTNYIGFEYQGNPSNYREEISSPGHAVTRLMEHQKAEVRITEINGHPDITHYDYTEIRSPYTGAEVNWNSWAVTRVVTDVSSDDVLGRMVDHHALLIEGIWQGAFVVHMTEVTPSGVRFLESWNHENTPRGPELEGIIPLSEDPDTDEFVLLGKLQQFSEGTLFLGKLRQVGVKVMNQDADPPKLLAKGSSIKIPYNKLERLLREITNEQRVSNMQFLLRSPLFSPEKKTRHLVTCRDWVSDMQNTVFEYSSFPISFFESTVLSRAPTRFPEREEIIVHHSWNVYKISFPKLLSNTQQ